MNKETRSLLLGLFNLAIMFFLVWKAFTAESDAALGAWTAATFSFMTFLLVEKVLERLASPVYSVYIDQMSVDDAARVMEKAFAKDPYTHKE